jgi:hypothetical protein
MMISAGGMAATAVRNVLLYGRSDVILRHPRVTKDGGHGTTPEGGDLPYLRWTARRVWHNATDPAGPDSPPVDLGPAFNTSWAGDPEGVEAIAVHAWRREGPGRRAGTGPAIGGGRSLVRRIDGEPAVDHRYRQ